MNARILELLKSPEIIEKQDLDLLQIEINNFPYLQSLRLLNLYGIHLFEIEKYSEHLSETAAYTTDKKMIYQFINQKKNILTDIFEQEKIISEKTEETQQNSDLDSRINLNYIFVPEVENFQEKTPTYNINCKESDINPSFSTKIEENSPAKIDLQTNEKEDKQNNSQLNFHSSEDFLPKVNVRAKTTETYRPQESEKSDKHRLEMMSLIAEVEAKIKKSKTSIEKTKNENRAEKTQENTEINFAETMEFSSSEEISNETSKEEIKPISNPNWKPISAVYSIPDSLINPQQETTTRLGIGQPKIKNEEERPVMNVSFFAPELVQIKTENSEIKEEEKTITQTESNIPNFINTWQNWLKIDRTETSKTEIEKEKNKVLAIEKFIETEPKISKLSEETSFTPKEKNDDISHLMTETLVNLYIEQRLYSKAIKGFEILKEKFPEKEDYFESRITEVKDLKQNKPS